MRATLLLCTLIAGAAAAAPPSRTEPRPFRLEAALAGRGFAYNDESFLHR